MTTGQIGRRSARAFLVLAVGLVATTWFFGFFAAPGVGGSMFEPTWQHQVLAALPYAVAVFGQAVGLTLMVRMSRAHREPEPDGWRYHDLD